MVNYKLITPIIKYANKIVGEVCFLNLDDDGHRKEIQIEGEKEKEDEERKAYGTMFAIFYARQLDALAQPSKDQQGRLPFFIKDQNNTYKLELKESELGQLLEHSTINGARMRKEYMEDVVLDIRNIKPSPLPESSQIASLENEFYILKNFKFKCNFNVQP